MATNIPPHNLAEVIDGVCAQIDHPDITLDELMKHVKGPDFPTGCMICGIGGIRQYFEKGRGSLKVRGKAGVEELKGGRQQIVITEIPYGVNRATLVERIAELVNQKILTDISYVGDQAGRQSESHHQQPLQAYCAGKFICSADAGDRWRTPEATLAQRSERLLYRAPSGSAAAAHPV